MSDPAYILAGTSHEYTQARRKLDLTPMEAGIANSIWTWQDLLSVI